MPVIIKTAGVAIYGGYLLLATLLGFIYGISPFGVGFKCGRFLPAAETRESRRDIFYPQFYFQLASLIIISCLFVSFYTYFDKFFLKSGLVFLKWLVFPFLLSNFFYSQAAAYFVSTHRIKYFNIVTVAFPYINIFLILLVSSATHRLSVNVLFVTQIISYTLLAVPLAVMVIKEIGIKFIVPEFKSLKEDIQLGFPLRINYVTDVFLGSSDRYLIAYFISVVAVGYYNPGYALGSLMLFLPKVSSIVLIPLLSKAIDSANEAEAYNMLNYAIKGFLLLAIPFIAGSAALSGPVLILFANTEVSREAYLVTPIIAVGTLFLGLNIILSNALWVKMKTTVMFRMNILAVAISILLNVLFLYFYKNILVAALTSLISYATVFVFVRRAVIKVWSLDFGVPVIIKSMAASALMAAVIFLASNYWGAKRLATAFLAVEIIIGLIVYVLGLFVFRAFSDREIVYLRKVFV